MPRQMRLDLAGVPQHVIQRGNNRQPCFHCEHDFLCYLTQLTEASQKHEKQKGSETLFDAPATLVLVLSNFRRSERIKGIHNVSDPFVAEAFPANKPRLRTLL